MEQLISVQAVAKSFGGRALFESLDFSIAAGECIGLIGANGSGKSTLLRILAGVEVPDAGEISRKKGLRVAYVPQQDTFSEDESAEDILLAAVAEVEADEASRYAKVGALLKRGAIDAPEQKAASLSGGQRKRLAICAALIQEPELLLLDEPTNHLDIDGVLWLEALLKKPPFGVLVISHDRYFLEHRATRVVEISPLYKEGYFSAVGGYSSFLEKRATYAEQQKSYEASLKNKVAREIEWLQRGPKARTTKAKARIEDANEQIEELREVRERNRTEQGADLDFQASGRKTRRLVEAKKVGKYYDARRILGDVSFVLGPGTRLGLIGKNGAGKSTLVQLIAGSLAPDAGEMWRAEGLRVVYFDQHRKSVDQSLTLKEALAKHSDSVVLGNDIIHVVAWAKRFLFRQEQLVVPVSQLSGGEQARIAIANLMLQPADILLLDEPTNDLDIASLDLLEENLSSFPGAVVLVSHDRYLLDRLATQVLVLEGDGVTQSFADYAQWEEARLRGKGSSGKQMAAEQAQAKAPKKEAIAKLSYKEQLELERIEADVAQAEQQLVSAQTKSQDPAIQSDAEALTAAYAAVEAAQSKVDALFARWQELEDKRASLSG